MDAMNDLAQQQMTNKKGPRVRRLLSHEETQTTFSGFPLEGSEGAWYKKWARLKRNADNYTYAKCSLSFEDYLMLAVKAGIKWPAEIGPNLGQYQMARLGDIGDYKMGNCRFVLREQNIQEWRDNGGAAVCGQAQLGRRKETHPGVKSMALKMVDIHAKTYEVVGPNGTVFKGRNLKLLCNKHGLNIGAMSLVLNGHRNHHKGWTGHYIEGTIQCGV